MSTPIYRKLSPPPRLAPLVEGVWVQDSQQPQAPQQRPTRILPTTKLDLVVYYREPFVQVGSGQPEVLPRISLCGQRTRPIQVAATGSSGVLVVNFFAWGAEPCFRVPLQELTDRCIDLALLLDPAQVRRLAERIMEASDTSQRVQILQQFLSDLAPESLSDYLVVEAAQRLNGSSGTTPVSRLAQQLGCSRRHLLRRFKQTAGISPKTFARIVRFQKALCCKRAGVGWSEIADRLGYFDQSHFIKEMKAFAGFSPECILSKHPETPLMSHFNGNDLAHFYNTTYL